MAMPDYNPAQYGRFGHSVEELSTEQRKLSSSARMLLAVHMSQQMIAFRGSSCRGIIMPSITEVSRWTRGRTALDVRSDLFNGEIMVDGRGTSDSRNRVAVVSAAKLADRKELIPAAPEDYAAIGKMLISLQQGLDNPGSGFWESVDIQQLDRDYASLLAVPPRAS